MSAKELPSEISKVLRESHFAYFCTTDRNNQAHITPMFFLFDETTKEIFVFAYLKSKKIRNIQVNPKVCLTVDVRDPRNPFENRGVMVQGEATIEKTSDMFSIGLDKKLMRIYKDFSKKYPVLSEEQTPTQVRYQQFVEVLVKVRPNKMVYWKGPHFVTVIFDPESGTPIKVIEV
jgi:general stress protein 26